jgi:hypothetical protein
MRLQCDALGNPLFLVFPSVYWLLQNNLPLCARVSFAPQMSLRPSS